MLFIRCLSITYTFKHYVLIFILFYLPQPVFVYKDEILKSTFKLYPDRRETYKLLTKGGFPRNTTF